MAGSLDPLRRRTVPSIRYTVPSMRLWDDDLAKVNGKSAMPLAECRSCPIAVGMKAREKRGDAIRQRPNLGPHHDFARAGRQAEPRAALLVELERFRDIQIRDRNLPAWLRVARNTPVLRACRRSIRIPARLARSLAPSESPPKRTSVLFGEFYSS